MAAVFTMAFMAQPHEPAYRLARAFGESVADGARVEPAPLPGLGGEFKRFECGRLSGLTDAINRLCS